MSEETGIKPPYILIEETQRPNKKSMFVGFLIGKNNFKLALVSDSNLDLLMKQVVSQADSLNMNIVTSQKS